MDKQEIFDIAYNGVMNQNGVAIAGEIDGEIDGEKYALHSGACFYRKKNKNSDILKCGVGHLLTDEELLTCRTSRKPSLDKQLSLYEPTSYNLFSISGVDEQDLPERLRDHLKLLVDIQEGHDYAVSQTAERLPELPDDPDFISLFKENFKKHMKHLAEGWEIEFNH